MRYELAIENGVLVLRIVPKPRKPRRYQLENLIAGITPETCHGEIAWGPPVGDEVW
jgi:antitoxin MazE